MPKPVSGSAATGAVVALLGLGALVAAAVLGLATVLTVQSTKRDIETVKESMRR